MARKTKNKALTTIEFRRMGGLGGITETYRRPLIHQTPTVDVKFNRFQVMILHARLDAASIASRQRSARADEVVSFITRLMVLAADGEMERLNKRLRKMLKVTVIDEAQVNAIMFTLSPRLEPRRLNVPGPVDSASL